MVAETVRRGITEPGAAPARGEDTTLDVVRVVWARAVDIVIPAPAVAP